jgi:hypothetical protein
VQRDFDAGSAPAFVLNRQLRLARRSIAFIARRQYRRDIQDAAAQARRRRKGVAMRGLCEDESQIARDLNDRAKRPSRLIGGTKGASPC